MPDQPYLGICFYGNKLYYAVSGEDDTKRKHIGCLDFGFNVENAVQQIQPDLFPGVFESIAEIKKKFEVKCIRILTNACNECWTTLPKSVYDVPGEREAYLDIIMQGVPRNQIEAVWYAVSNRDYKMISIRNRRTTRGLEKLAELSHSADFCSDFEIGTFWIKHAGKKNNFLMLSCYKSHLCISSYLLGKLRAATYIKYEHLTDLPYFWLQQKKNLSWFDGIHDEMIVFGESAKEVHQGIAPYLDDNTKTLFMDSLKKINITAKEQSYSFDLKQAFPAIMLASN